MDDFGNLYQTEEWEWNCHEYAHSMSTFGQFDEWTIGLCIRYELDYAAQIV